MRIRHAMICALVGCGGGTATVDGPPSGDALVTSTDTPSGTVVGMLDGMTFTPMDVQWNNVELKAPRFQFVTGSTTFIEMTSFTGECALQGMGSGVAGARRLGIALYKTDASGKGAPVTEPGTYMVTAANATPAPSSKIAQPTFEAEFPTSCGAQQLGYGVSGSVVLTSAKEPLTGTFDFTVNTDHVTGTFKAASCAVLDPSQQPHCP